MVKQQAFLTRDILARTILAAVIVVIGLSLAGCGDEMAKMEDRQLRLEAMVEANNTQIAAMAESIEQNQQDLQASLEAVKDNIRQVSADFVTIAEEQTRLHKALQSSTQQANARMDAVERGQHGLQANIEQARNANKQTAAEVAALAEGQARFAERADSENQRISGRVELLEGNQGELQTAVEDVRSGTLRVASDVTSLKDEQVRLTEMVENNGRQLTDNAAVVEQNREAWQAAVDRMQENIQRVTANVETLGTNLSRLEGIIQSNVRELTGLVNTSGQGQAQLQEKMQRDLSTLDGSINAIRENQSRLQGQIQDVRNNAEMIINEMPAALDRLRDELLSKMTENETSSSHAKDTE